MKRFALLILICVGIVLPISSFGSEQRVELYLRGVELTKGQDVGEIRYGTRFAGQVLLDSNDAESVIGYWSVSLNYTDVENVEVCGGTNDIISLRLLVVLDDDNYSGEAIFSMSDFEGNPDVFWNSQQPLCGFFGIGCSDPWESPETWDCDDGGLLEGYGPVAQIGSLDNDLGIKLNPVWRTGIFKRPDRVKHGYIKGWLRHNYPVVPRIDGTLILDY